MTAAPTISAASDPFETMMADVPVGSVPSLEQARRELERLLDIRDDRLRELRDRGFGEELREIRFGQENGALFAEIATARAAVAAEEAAEAHRQSIPQPKPEDGP